MKELGFLLRDYAAHCKRATFIHEVIFGVKDLVTVAIVLDLRGKG